jgi:hemerythrin-like domain-containing protein
MRPTDVLTHEHRVIEGILSSLGTLATAAEGGVLDGLLAEEAIHLLRRYGDTWHHGKEERWLFPLLVGKVGSPSWLVQVSATDVLELMAGPSTQLLQDHEEARNHMEAMTRALDNPSIPLPRRCFDFVHHARACILHLRKDIAREDEGLFPLADAILGPEESMVLLEAFARFEAETFAPGEVRGLEARAAVLARRLPGSVG